MASLPGTVTSRVSPVPILRPSVQLSFLGGDNIVKDKNWNLTDQTLQFSTIATPATQVPVTTSASSSEQNVASSLPSQTSSRSVPVPANPAPLASSAAQGTQESEELAVCLFFFLSFVSRYHPGA